MPTRSGPVPTLGRRPHPSSYRLSGHRIRTVFVREQADHPLIDSDVVAVAHRFWVFRKTRVRFSQTTYYMMAEICYNIYRVRMSSQIGRSPLDLDPSWLLCSRGSVRGGSRWVSEEPLGCEGRTLHLETSPCKFQKDMSLRLAGRIPDQGFAPKALRRRQSQSWSYRGP